MTLLSANCVDGVLDCRFFDLKDIELVDQNYFYESLGRLKDDEIIYSYVDDDMYHTIFEEYGVHYA